MVATRNITDLNSLTVPAADDIRSTSSNNSSRRSIGRVSPHLMRHTNGTEAVVYSFHQHLDKEENHSDSEDDCIVKQKETESDAESNFSTICIPEKNRMLPVISCENTEKITKIIKPTKK